MTLQYLDIAIAIGVVMLAVSLLITILTQLVASILSLRGSNLRWAVTTLIQEVHPDLQDQAAKIANDVLTHPLISDSTLSRFAQMPFIGRLFKRWSLANAVRLEELVGVLDLLGGAAAAPVAAAPVAAAPVVAAPVAGAPVVAAPVAVAPVVAAPVVAAPVVAVDAAQRAAMATIAQAAKEKMGPQVQAVARQTLELVNGLRGAAAGLAGGQAVGTINVDQLLEKIPGAAETVFGKDIKSWFNSVMDRATQRFTLHMRVVSVMLSIAVAFALHLDSFQLFSDLSTSPDLRASLVAQADSMQRLAGSVLATAPTSTADAPTTPAKPGNQALTLAVVHVPAVYAAALRELKKSKDASTEKAAMADAQLLKPVDDMPSDQNFTNRTAAVEWLKRHVTRADAADRLAQEYQSTVDRLLQAGPDTDKLLDRAAEVQSVINQTRFRLLPDPYPDLRVWNWRWRTVFGVLFSAGLLGLGAPFWFNALKTLTALRPILASKQDKETQAAKV
jgi:hypothetical protein